MVKKSWVESITSKDLAYADLINKTRDKIFLIFREAHEKTKITQHDIYNHISRENENGNPNVISGILSGNRHLSLQLLAFVADALGYDVEINFINRVPNDGKKENASTSGS